jgi:hypothetical protein
MEGAGVSRSTISRGPAVGVALLAAVMSGGATAQDGAEPAGDEPRVARECLNHPAIKRTKILNDRNIVFVTRDDTIYNNQLPRQCPSLKRNSLVNYPIQNGRLCAGNNFQLLWEASPRNYVPAFVCQLGVFVPITEGELADLTAMTDEDRQRKPRRRSAREAVTTEQVELPAEAAEAAEPESPTPDP